MAWSGSLVVIPQQDGSVMIGETLPPGRHSSDSFYTIYYRGSMPIVGFPKMEKVQNVDDWILQKKQEGFEISKTTPFPLPSKIVEVASDWFVLIPMTMLKISHEPPFNGEWSVGDVRFLSIGKAKAMFGNGCVDNIAKIFGLENQQNLIHSFAIIESSGTKNDVSKTAFRDVREAKDILIASCAFMYSRNRHTNCNLMGYPTITQRNLCFLEKRSNALSGSWTSDGSFFPVELDVKWIEELKSTNMSELFNAITDQLLDAAWRSQIKRAASFIGRSLGAFERSDSLLRNIIALETMLTIKRERNGPKLQKRLEGLFGWVFNDPQYGHNARPDYATEISRIFDVRCEIVHDADYSNLTAELIHISDVYAQNTLLNIVTNRSEFTSKDELRNKLDGYSSNKSWPSNLRFSWIDSPYSESLESLPLW